MLKLIPERFRAINIALGDIEELDLKLGKRKNAFTVDALRLSSEQITIVLRLKLAVTDDVGLAVDYAADFNVADESVDNFEVTDETLKDTFIQVNAPAIAYPFLRAYVSTLTVNSGYEQILLPPVNFQAMFNKRKEAGELSPSIPVR